VKVVRYEKEHEHLWDNFLNEYAINGTFLQSRNFLNYHPVERFTDCSLIVCRQVDEKQICAVIPACEYVEDGKKVFHAHKGSTLGGLVISDTSFTIQGVADLVDLLDSWLLENRFGHAILKITPDILSLKHSDLLQYILWNRGYRQYAELNTYIDFSSYSTDLLANFKNNRVGDVKKGRKMGWDEFLTFKPLVCESEINDFYDVLCENLLKFNTTPIHTKNEIFLLKRKLRDSLIFFGVYENNQLIAGAMLFFFEKTFTFHTQYLCARQDKREYSPMVFLYYKIIEFVQSAGANCLSLGTSNAHQGKVLNIGLAKSKEAYGGQFSLNLTFYKTLEVKHEQ